MSTAIKVENLSKAYQLGDFGTGTISRDLERYWARMRGKEDPFLKIGETNDRTTKGESDVVWSLRDINFDIEQGDAVGIIGRNGAGKSTLLKILSRVTSPTTGSVKVKGRIASLLEVGTGFHPELTGKENIYLNGAILGMRKAEIKRKFDEIVDFSGVERYIDTPVKRYSSGMYVRLAFAVAAHLESEILIVDEVLAVGDAEFQKKCLGKMGDVSRGEGKTVLFVSHNLGAVQKLCNKGILLNNGQVTFNGSCKDAVYNYSQNGVKTDANFLDRITYSSDNLKITNILFNNSSINDIVLNSENNFSFEIKVELSLKTDMPLDIECRFLDRDLNRVAFFSPGHHDGVTVQNKGEISLSYKITFPHNLNKINMDMNLYFTHPDVEIYASCENALSIEYTGYGMASGHVFEYEKGVGMIFLPTDKSQ
ncbi:lipopolysaccharide transport system ATP-binding protein [Mucilaginibacter lappiensis]|uniref:Lipopolysaccharide transport system ATP-binding protein n=1 Tax=Mucilaginibacter lappiensis TaxID=354630 RepID=A0ABR6PMA6_9SPHI|nr:ABC transporter ATP-binding protein [Mucilaginibacter lappiensis]MBB6110906.1 lipopolysaccharide transport system ATP-binding protein [Mucilaginibacter lappiensis]SIR60941.1 lipopolysaccharide transport system ATP-binding protein [Mucilaginibacter lappiensis]